MCLIFYLFRWHRAIHEFVLINWLWSHPSIFKRKTLTFLWAWWHRQICPQPWRKSHLWSVANRSNCERRKEEINPFVSAQPLKQQNIPTKCRNYNLVENIVTYHLHALHEWQSDCLVSREADHTGRSVRSGLQQRHHCLHTHPAALDNKHTVRSLGVCVWGLKWQW